MKKTKDKREFKCPFPCSCTWRQTGQPKCPVKNATVSCSDFMSREEFEAIKKSGNAEKLKPAR